MFVWRFFIVAIALGIAPIMAEEFAAKPRQIIDGDTLSLNFRFKGIDTPETRQRCERQGACYPCGVRATEALRELITTKQGKLKELRFKVWETGRYGRLIVTPFLGNKDISLELIKQGWALAYRRYLPDALRADYLAAEQDAKTDKRGMWDGAFIEPWKWRRGARLACEKK